MSAVVLSIAMPKADTLTPEHLTWLVQSRYANQRAAVRLFTLFEKYSTKVHTKAFSTTSQRLVSICFSLWRAAFLSDKTGKRAAVVEDAKAFLEPVMHFCRSQPCRAKGPATSQPRATPWVGR